MNGQKTNVFMPALVGGVAAGILSGIPVLNCLCCLWIIGGAMLAAYLLSKDSPLPLSSGDGALVGAFAGVIAAAVDSLLSIPFQALNAAFLNRVFEQLAEYNKEFQSNWSSWINRSAGPFSVAWFFLGLVISAAIFAVLGALGGIIGIALFGKKAPTPPRGAPPAPQAPQPPAPPQP